MKIEEKNKNALLLIFILLATLSVAEVSWWNIFIYRNNITIHDSMLEKLELKKKYVESIIKYDSITVIDNDLQVGLIIENDSVKLNPKYLARFKKDLEKKRTMIWSESIFFIVLIGIGFFLIYKTIKHEQSLGKQQSNFMLSITHELKTPLASIKLLLQTMQSKESLSLEKKQHFIETALDEISRLSRLIDNILLSSQEMEKISIPERNRYNLSEYLNHILEPFLHQTDTKIDLVISENIMGKLNKNVLIIIINNLLSNAIKYNNSDIKEIAIVFKENKNKLNLTISDNGIGISDSLRNKIFNKFYRIGSEETRQSSGTGLGLYIVKKLSEKCHLTIHCTNNAPQGTIFALEWEEKI